MRRNWRFDLDSLRVSEWMRGALVDLHHCRYLDHLGMQDGKNQTTALAPPLKSKRKDSTPPNFNSVVPNLPVTHRSLHSWLTPPRQLMQFVGFPTTFRNRRTNLNVSMASWLYSVFHYDDVLLSIYFEMCKF